MIKTAIILLCLIPSLVFGETCPKTRIEKGTAAPCTGYLLSPEVMEEATKLPKEISLLNEKLQIKENQLNFKDEKILLYINHNDKKDITINGLQAALIEKDKNESLKLGLAIGGTALATALLCVGIVFAVSGSYKLSIVK